MKQLWRAAAAVFLSNLMGLTFTALAFILGSALQFEPSPAFAFLYFFLLVLLPSQFAAVFIYARIASWYGETDIETRCRKCGYILRGLTEPRCAECGEWI